MDAVIIGSPSALHAKQGITAAEHGLHVLVEKPIDVTVARADALIDACARAQVKLGVCYQDRFAPDANRLKEFIESDGLGKILLVTSHVKWYRPPEYYSGSGWRGKPEFDGGGALMNQGVHTIDLLLWLLGDVKKCLCVVTDDAPRYRVRGYARSGSRICKWSHRHARGQQHQRFRVMNRWIEITGSEGTIIFKHDRIVAADLRKDFPGGLSAQQHDTNLSASSPIVSDVTRP